jgi:cellulose synthase/poly-beta-1,6-N-acetylglucosamine synthase-like glycosyltransferase
LNPLNLGYLLLTLSLIPFFTFLALVACAALVARRSRFRPAAALSSQRSPRFLFVIPAHNEQANIQATIASCRAVAYDASAFTVAVIADNCTDATAHLARETGAEVLERFSDEHRSKGHALEYFFQQKGIGSPRADGARTFDAVVVIDADTNVDRDLLTHFATSLDSGTDWAQCYYTVLNPDASWRTRLLTYAFALFNGVWLLGQDHIGLSVGLRGNGMCFSTRGLERFPWRAYGLVEDHEFSWMLRLAGERVRFVPETRVYAEMVTGGKAAESQRQRWEQGRGSLRASFLRPLLGARNIGPVRKTLFVVDLLFPSLMVLFAVLFLALTVQPAALLIPDLRPLARSLAVPQGFMLLTTLLYALSPCLVMGLPARYLAGLVTVPYYAFWKFLTVSRQRATGWVRTERET